MSTHLKRQRRCSAALNGVWSSWQREPIRVRLGRTRIAPAAAGALGVGGGGRQAAPASSLFPGGLCADTPPEATYTSLPPCPQGGPAGPYPTPTTQPPCPLHPPPSPLRERRSGRAAKEPAGADCAVGSGEWAEPPHSPWTLRRRGQKKGNFCPFFGPRESCLYPRRALPESPPGAPRSGPQGGLLDPPEGGPDPPKRGSPGELTGGAEA